MPKKQRSQPIQDTLKMDPTQWQLDKIEEIKTSDLRTFHNMPQPETYSDAASIIGSFVKIRGEWEILADNEWTRQLTRS